MKPIQNVLSMLLLKHFFKQNTFLYDFHTEENKENDKMKNNGVNWANYVEESLTMFINRVNQNKEGDNEKQAFSGMLATKIIHFYSAYFSSH